jgi:hypothetical protein
MFNQALKSGYNACVKICNKFTANNIPENVASRANPSSVPGPHGWHCVAEGPGENQNRNFKFLVVCGR